MCYKLVATRAIRNKAIAGSVFGNNNIVGNSRLEFLFEHDGDLKDAQRRMKKQYPNWFVNVTLCKG